MTLIHDSRILKSDEAYPDAKLSDDPKQVTCALCKIMAGNRGLP